jgi:thioester reductase-like protein
VKPTVFLTGATGFLGMEVLARLLEEGDREVLALIRASDDAAAERRLDDVLATLWDDPAPYRARVSAVRGDVTAPGLGLGDRRDELAERTQAVLHCAASITFDLPLAEARAINVDGTARVLDFAVDAQAREGLERFLHVSTAYVAGRHEGTFRERQLDAGQAFRNTYEETKADAEQIVTLARELGPAIARPSIVVGESDSGWTPAFNVLYWPLRAFSRGLFDVVPAHPERHVDVVPVDYVADSVDRLARGGPDGTFHLVAGRNATTVGRLMELASRRFGRPAPPVFPPRLYSRLVHPVLLQRLGQARRDGLRRMEVYFPYFSMRVRFGDRRHPPAPPVEGYFDRLLDFAERARWGRRPVERPSAAGVVPLSA